MVNPCTGKLEWVQQDRDVTSEEADISRELARSQYGDMLLDTLRVSEGSHAPSCMRERACIFVALSVYSFPDHGVRKWLLQFAALLKG